MRTPSLESHENPLAQERGQRLSGLFPRRWILEQAKASGFVEGVRNLDPMVFFWHLVLAFGSSSRLCLLRLHRSHEKVAPDRMTWPAFYDRFTPERLEFLKRCLERAMARVVFEALPARATALEACDIREIVAIDSTLIPLHPDLAEGFPDARSTTCPAAAKLNVQLGLLNRAPRAFSVPLGQDGRKPPPADGGVDGRAPASFRPGFFQDRALPGNRR
ncbi:hypothetical protein [Aminirod propionatiphilus]|uniref:Uncharacterized protein n=1 Tax=Aminirod propionatiphilus TaxID=3415223 RepID=A0ACD1DW59_9BACT|nr:hypothetical protein KIH16_00590 [Synergistota bacterium]